MAAVFNRDEEYIEDPILEEESKEEQKAPSFEEIVKKINGTDELGKAYASGNLSFYYKDSENPDDDLGIMSELSFAGPVFHIKEVADPAGKYSFMQIDITFGVDNTKDLIAFWRILEEYREAYNSISENDTVFPMLSLLIKPNEKPEYEAKNIIYFLYCEVPFKWDICADYPGRNANTISLLFDFDFCSIVRNLLTMETTKEVINQETIRARAKAEDELRKQAEQEEKDQEFMEEMHEKIKNEMYHAEADQAVIRVGRRSNEED